MTPSESKRRALAAVGEVLTAAETDPQSAFALIQQASLWVKLFLQTLPVGHLQSAGIDPNHLHLIRPEEKQYTRWDYSADPEWSKIKGQLEAREKELRQSKAAPSQPYRFTKIVLPPELKK